jgi:hypothetical protein
MIMILVTIATIYQTIVIALFLLISKGWNVSTMSVSRADMSSITLLMGAVYLTYSAYYVSINIEGLKIFIGVRLSNNNEITLVFTLHTIHCSLHCCNKVHIRHKEPLEIITLHPPYKWSAFNARIYQSQNLYDEQVLHLNALLFLFHPLQQLPGTVL